jgi:hypothetical protein
MTMPGILQKVLLGVGILALIALVIEISLSVAATMHGNTPKKVVHVTAGPYPLTVSLYDDPANAGFALPFAVAPGQPVRGSLTFNISSIPGEGVHATPVRASISPDPKITNGIQGAAEITVQGPWSLHIAVDGSAGHGEVNVPITAAAPPAIPGWLGWTIGFIPFLGLFAFLLMQRNRKGKQEPPAVAQEPSSSQVGSV